MRRVSAAQALKIEVQVERARANKVAGGSDLSRACQPNDAGRKKPEVQAKPRQNFSAICEVTIVFASLGCHQYATIFADDFLDSRKEALGGLLEPAIRSRTASAAPGSCDRHSRRTKRIHRRKSRSRNNASSRLSRSASEKNLTRELPLRCAQSARAYHPSARIAITTSKIAGKARQDRLEPCVRAVLRGCRSESQWRPVDRRAAPSWTCLLADAVFPAGK